MASEYQRLYKERCDEFKMLEAAKCKPCSGFGYLNGTMGHTAGPL